VLVRPLSTPASEGRGMKNQRWEILFLLFFPLIGIIIALLLPLVQAIRDWAR
jgi:hypothetical protein